MSLPESGGAAFGHSDVAEFAFLLQAGKGLDDLLDWHIGGHARALKEVHLLDAAELLVDGINAAAQVLWTTDS